MRAEDYTKPLFQEDYLVIPPPLSRCQLPFGEPEDWGLRTDDHLESLVWKTTWLSPHHSDQRQSPVISGRFLAFSGSL